MSYGRPLKMVPRFFNDERLNVRLAGFFWRCARNLPSTLDYLLSARRLGPEGTRILQELETKGIAITSTEALGLTGKFSEVKGDLPAMDGSSIGRRTAGDTRWLSGRSELKRAIDRYCGLTTIAWQGGRIVHSPSGTVRTGNAKWHVDVEDYRVVKVFVLLTEVESTSGATEYLTGSHPSGIFAHEAVAVARTASFSEYAASNQDRIVSACGAPGTVFVFDARGIHRGGYVLQGKRDVLFQAFMAPNWIHDQDALVKHVAQRYERPELGERGERKWKRLTDWIRW